MTSKISYEDIPFHIKLNIIWFLKIKPFMKFCFMNKESNNLCKEYLRVKKIAYEREKKKKTVWNCLLVLDNKITYWKFCRTKIVKIVKCEKDYFDGRESFKITYWIISDMGKIKGRESVVHPGWCQVKSIPQKNLIPFY